MARNFGNPLGNKEVKVEQEPVQQESTTKSHKSQFKKK